MKKKLVSIAAVVVVAGAIGAAPASAAPSGNQSIAALGACASAKTTNEAVACLTKAAGGLKVSKGKLPFDIKSLLGGFSGSAGGSGGIKLPGLGGLKLPGGLDLSKMLGGLNLSKLLGGLDLSKLLGGLKL